MTVFLWTPVQHCARHHYELNIECCVWVWMACKHFHYHSLQTTCHRVEYKNFHLKVMKVSFLRMQSLSIWDCSVTSYLLHYATNSQCLVSWTCWRWTHQIFETLERTTTADVLEQIKASMSLLPPATQASQQTLEYRNSFNWFIVPESFSVGFVHVQVGALFEKTSVSESDSFSSSSNVLKTRGSSGELSWRCSLSWNLAGPNPQAPKRWEQMLLMHRLADRSFKKVRKRNE